MTKRRIGIITFDNAAAWGGEVGWGEFITKRFEDNLSDGSDLKFEVILGMTNPLPNKDEIPNYTGFIITGSHSSVNENLPWKENLEEFVRYIHYTDLSPKPKIYGICFGHQLIAKALGGKVKKNASKKMKIGGEIIECFENLTMSEYYKNIFGERTSLKMLEVHGEEVRVLPKDAVVLGKSPSCRHEVLSYGEHILTSQGHPELLETKIKELIMPKLIRKGGRINPDEIRKMMDSFSEVEEDNMVKLVINFFSQPTMEKKILTINTVKIIGLIICETGDAWGGEAGMGDFVKKRFNENIGVLEKSYKFEVIHGISGSLPTEEEMPEYSGFVIIGLLTSVNENQKASWVKRLEKFVQRIHNSHISQKHRIFGINFGHHLIAKSLGGTVETNASKKLKFGGETVEFFEELTTKDYYNILEGQQSFKMLQAHQEEVSELPTDAVVLGTSPSCRYEVLSYGDHILTCQGNPELLESTMKEIIMPRAIRKYVNVKRTDIADMLSSFEGVEQGDKLVEFVISFLTHSLTTDDKE